MSMDLTGIRNQNEYYTNHYLSSVFEENAAETIRAWREKAAGTGEKTPWSLLNAFARRYFIHRDQAARARGSQLGAITETAAGEFLAALGYAPSGVSRQITLSDALTLDVFLEMKRGNGAPLMWVLLCDDSADEEDFLDSRLFCAGRHTPESVIASALFDIDEPPRWLLFIGLKQAALIDRNKWNEKRFLMFDLDEIFSRREESTLQAVSVLLHRESICPQEGTCLLDTLDENSHKHASGVSKDLKYALRECIELLGNEVMRDRRERQHLAVYGKDLAGELSLECLRYMYRILFMLFIEARSDLGFAPIKAEVYALGYSFESLRDIADNARGDGEINPDGNYIKYSLDKLFSIIYNGYPTGDASLLDGLSLQGTFRVEALKAHIFDPERTKLIEQAHIRNEVLLKIIDLMSLTRAQKGKRRGRISYSNLGINQLGSVYEALLSYRGFFAEEDLYEVKRKGDKVDDLDVGYFVTEAELCKYDEDERVRTGDDPASPLRVHPRGEFIYRLAGREREKSASYYTPEVLTQCLVKYALRELLQDKTADEILHLTVCEPAMGSAAFLNEAVSQLAEAYLVRKEKELGKQIPHDARGRELQKIKMLIADRNVYGIDLNPTAVELAEVSLWLNTIYEGAYVPWFRTQLINGNSLIGARRQCYTESQCRVAWYDAAPERVPLGTKRRPRQIYHFLLGDPGMCAYTDKVIKSLEAEKLEKIKKWQKAFTKPLSEAEIDQVMELSGHIDRLWEEHIRIRTEINDKTTDPLTVWGQGEDTQHSPMSIRDKDRIFEELYLTKDMRNAGPYARLKAAMDYWCALWFWPIEHADELPERKEFLFDMYALLGADIVDASASKRQSKGQIGMFEDEFYADMFSRFDTYGAVNLEQLRALFPRMKIAAEVAERQKFFHWELEFADVFAKRGGFDLIVGNPPWIKMEWNEQAVLGDRQPLFAVKKFTATQTTKVRAEELKDASTYALYFGEYESMTGTQAFLNAGQNYPDLKGQQTNLYKCFLPQAWMFAGASGVSAFVHPDGVYDDPKGGRLREKLYPKLRYHFQFTNELKLFSEVHHCTVYSLNVYNNTPTTSFDTIGNLYAVNSIGECYADRTEVVGPLPGIKDENGWCVKGHPDRVIRVGKKELCLFARLFDGSEVWQSARLPVLHCRQFVEVLEKFAEQKRTLGDLGDKISTNEMWHETNSQKDGTIVRDIHFPSEQVNMIYSGPHLGIANPYFKSSRRKCVLNSDYDSIDLTNIGEYYMQRCNFSPSCSLTEYLHRAPTFTNDRKALEGYRILWRSMLNQSGERTMLPMIVPPYVGHVDLVYEFVSNNITNTIVAGTFASIPFDFYIKVTGKSHARYDVISSMPYLENVKQVNGIMLRALLLNCLTRYYGDLWIQLFDYVTADKEYLCWSKADPRLSPSRFTGITPDWTWDTPLRTDYERRQALVEIDVLTAMALGMTLEQLKTIYRIQFPVLQQYEDDTWYDANGRIVFTTNRSLTGVGFDRPTWEREIKGAPAGKQFTRTITDDTQPGGPVERTITYTAPFDKCDREKDYETAWAYFSREKS